MIVKLDKLFLIFIAVGVIILPFDLLPIKLLGRLGSEGAFYPFFTGVCLWLLSRIGSKNNIFYSKNFSLKLFYAFFIWIICSFVFNFNDIYMNKFKGISGTEQFIKQIISMAFYILLTFFVYDIYCRENKFIDVFRKCCVISFCIAGSYSLIEIGAMFNNPYMSDILIEVNSMFRPENAIGYTKRIRSVSAEASWFAVYISFIFPWIISSVFFSEKKIFHLFLVAYMFFLLIFSWSRTAYVVMLFESILYIVLFKKYIINQGFLWLKLKIVLISLIFIGCLFAGQIYLETSFQSVDIVSIYSSLIFSEDSIYDLSNVARYGSQSAALEMFKNEPLRGCGFGQYGFYIVEFLPNWSWESLEIRDWAMNAINSPWPPVHSIYMRIIAELGAVGLILWIGIWSTLLVRLFKIRKNVNEKNQIIVNNVIISIIGCILTGFNLDAFSFLGYWIMFGIGLRIIDFDKF